MAQVGKLLSPLAEEEVGTIRCIGLNVSPLSFPSSSSSSQLLILMSCHAVRESCKGSKHGSPHRSRAIHASTLPTSSASVPVSHRSVSYRKPSTALADPYPAPTIIPKSYVGDHAADYESELVVVIGKKCKNVSEGDAMSYIAGYTASNDVSSRAQQFAQSQWCYSKSFDGACPIGPAFVPASQVKDIGELVIEGRKNGTVVQKSKLECVFLWLPHHPTISLRSRKLITVPPGFFFSCDSDLIFTIPKIVSFLSQGTTLNPGTIILTGTPAGVGWSSEPKNLLKDGDEFRVFVSHGVGTLINEIQEEK